MSLALQICPKSAYLQSQARAAVLHLESQTQTVAQITNQPELVSREPGWALCGRATRPLGARPKDQIPPERDDWNIVERSPPICQATNGRGDASLRLTSKKHRASTASWHL
jgi:hypothetical protein